MIGHKKPAAAETLPLEEVSSCAAAAKAPAHSGMPATTMALLPVTWWCVGTEGYCSAFKNGLLVIFVSECQQLRDGRLDGMKLARMYLSFGSGSS